MTGKRTILIAGMGTSPAVLAETVWALCHQEKPMVSDKGVVYAFCEMHNKCTKCTTDILRKKPQMRKTARKTGGGAAKVGSHRHANAVVKTTLQTTTQTTTQIPISSATRHVLDLLKAEPLLSGDKAAQRLGLTRDGFYYHVKILRKAVGLRHTGGTKRGRWEAEKS